MVRRPEVSERRGTEVETEGSVGELAHSTVEGLERGKREVAQGTGNGSSDESEVLGTERVRPVVDANGDRRRSGGLSASRGNGEGGWEERPETLGTSRANPEASRLSTDERRDVDDTDVEGLQRYRDWRDAHELPTWPPSPQSNEWFTERPTLEPAICRVVDGLDTRLDRSIYSNRVERLRAVGNGVVPITAALAFTTLAEELGYEIQR